MASTTTPIVFKNTISKDKDNIYQPEKGRYHLYVSLSCPWAHRTIITRKLKGLEDVISLSIVDYVLVQSTGWVFSPEKEGCTIDHINNFTHLKQVYQLSDQSYTGRVTVPVLFDTKTKTIVNNESSEIIRILNDAFNDWATNPQLQLYPESLKAEIDTINTLVYDNINTGVYKCAFAASQEDYEIAYHKLFKALDQVEEILSKQRYLVKGQFTEADIRLFTTLIRFDAVYYSLFKCNEKQIKEYPNLLGFVRDLYQNPIIKSTINFDHIKKGYYSSSSFVQSKIIVPVGPNLDYLNVPHGRDSLTIQLN